MTTSFVNSIVATNVLLAVTGIVVARSATGSEAAIIVPICEDIHQDKTGTNSVPKNESGSQVAQNKPNASHVSLEAEGTGFATSHFRISRTAINLRQKPRRRNDL